MNKLPLVYTSVSIYLVCALISCQEVEDIVFVLLSQANKYHTKLAELKKQDFYNQIKNSQGETQFLLLHEKWPDQVGGWTILPVISRITSDKQLHRKKWIFIFEEYTSFNLHLLLDLLKKYDPLQKHFLGHALWDQEPTIIHHFAYVENPSSFLYPDTSAGLILSMTLAKTISMQQEKELPDFSIDAKHELAQFIWDRGRGTKLQNIAEMCLRKSNGCVSWVENIPDCGTFTVNVEDVYFAVKTCKKFHSDRVPIVKKTWARDTRKLTFYSDSEDESVPTHNTGIPNTQRGHCAKTFAILKHITSLKTIGIVKWVVVADDDTLISVKRLIRLLSCYNSSEDLALGERYGFNVATGEGYDYVTGGGGMVFSVPTVRKIISSQDCYCLSESSPDDMTLGICLKKLGIAITHSPLFHQARPPDYSPDFLSYWEHISFHKHWMISPEDVYEDWLHVRDTSHSEL